MKYRYKNMTFRKVKRVACVAALAAAVAVVPFAAGCVNSHPEAEITIEYAGEQYVLQYKMYRKLYPQTVKHFIELADADFYDGTIIHDFRPSYWYGGNYTYADGYDAAYADGEEAISDYLESNSKEMKYNELAENGTLTPSVYLDIINGGYSQPLNTLIGEFSNNAHKFENSDSEKKRSFGCLATFYTAKPDDVINESFKNKRVYLDKDGSPMGVQGEYKYNCTTSLFSIQVGSSTSKDSNYTVFADLKNPDVLKSLQKAVGAETSYKDVELYVDNYDHFVSANVNDVTYRMRKEILKIVSVEITKY